MRIIWVRRLSQGFFFLLFLWFGLAATPGEAWWRLSGWPVNWLLQLDPLVGLGTVLATGALYAGLLWGLATLVLTLVFGRAFCGWVCPLGAMQQFMGWLGSRGRPAGERIAANQPRAGRRIKYYLLAGLLAAAAADLLSLALVRGGRPWWALAGVGLVWLAGLALHRPTLAGGKTGRRIFAAWAGAGLLTLAWWGLGSLAAPGGQLVAASLQSGLLDPIPLITRSLNLFLLPVVNALSGVAWPGLRLTAGGWLIAGMFLAILGLSVYTPRFYCRYVCPLGALLGLLGRGSLLRVGRRAPACRNCAVCQAHCEGACSPQAAILSGECVLCLNCFYDCPDNEMTYSSARSAAGEAGLDLSRRGILVSLATGFTAVPGLRLAGAAAAGWSPRLVRPPGALPEAEFLRRCLKCGQCMRVCPTGVIQPAGLDLGLEALWTPVLNMRLGTSGCQLNCVLCGHYCPTAALRPLTLDEKLGRGAFADRGPVRLGTAFFDRNRCLPWAMDRPCIVCQENCPVSPKAIVTRVKFTPLISGLTAGEEKGAVLTLAAGELAPGAHSGGDYYLQAGTLRRRILDNSRRELVLEPLPGDQAAAWQAAAPAGAPLELLVRLQQPQVDPTRCIGCGVCEHECPVGGQKAVRVSSTGETRDPAHAMLPGAR
ncbi:MAG: 4Fe-4S binding protein [Deltaproteobacteria bacterium]|nr:4Fe-4S binding protein [Deltaproteobacteria bacterium]